MRPETLSLRIGAITLAAALGAFAFFAGCTTSGNSNSSHSYACGCCEVEPTNKPANKPANNVSTDGKKDGGEEVCYLPPAAQTDIITKLKVGQVAPDWTMKDIRTGKDVKLADYKGKTVLLKFWASWCPQCKKTGEERMKPIFNHLVETKRTDIVFVAIGTNFQDDTAQSQKAELEVRGHGWQGVFDADGSATRNYGVDGIPAAVLVDGNGKIVTFGLYKREWGDSLDKYLNQECTKPQ
ncbi:MAG: TlpA family protein disulfide reductase [Planctomycetes bacterium]|nr:TlpA family protein disulfide reductase [Planctomycetota bacterium]